MVLLGENIEKDRSCTVSSLKINAVELYPLLSTALQGLEEISISNSTATGRYED